MSNHELVRIKKNLTNEKPEIRKKAFSSLKKASVEEAMPILLSLLGQKNKDVFEDITKAIIGYKDAALPYLVKSLTDEKWKIRKSASKILGKLGVDSLKKLMELIPENEDDVDYWMVQTLSNMGGEAIQYLVRMFKHPNHKVQLAAIRAAQNVDDPRMVEALLHLLSNQNWPIRKAAYDSLEKIHMLNQQAVVESLETCSEEAEFWIIKLLAHQATPELAEKFAEIVECSPMESKLEAIKALAMIETREAHRFLVGYLANKSWIIRKTAADSIWAQGLGASEELLSAINNPNVDARYWSVKLLGQTNEPSIFSEIVKCLDDPQASVRSAACQALGSLGDKRGLPHLMGLLNDDADEVRTAAILSLSLLGDKDEAIMPRPSVPAHFKTENQTKCPNCGKSVGKNFTFCPFCLGHLKNACRNCGRAVEPGWKGCPDCGASL